MSVGDRPTNEDQISELRLMMEDMESAPEVYRPTQFWQPAVLKLLSSIEDRGIRDFRSHPIAHNYYVPLYGLRGWHHHRNRYSLLFRLLKHLPKARGFLKSTNDTWIGQTKRWPTTGSLWLPSLPVLRDLATSARARSALRSNSSRSRARRTAGPS